MSDLISRQAVLDKFQALCDACGEGDKYNGVMCRACALDDGICIVEDIPSAEPKQRWIPVTEALPENRNVVLVTVYWHETYQVMEASYFGSDWWCVPFNNCGKHMQKLNPIAWMPLPEPWRGE